MNDMFAQQQPHDLPGGIGAHAQKFYEPGGAFVRLLANIVDGLIVGIPASFIQVPVNLAAQSLLENNGGLAFALYLISMLTGWILAGIFYGFFYSKYGASPGKMIFGLRVLDENTGNYPSPLKAAVREIFGKFLCAITLGIGFLMIPFRADKRGLHDLVCSTRVVRERQQFGPR